MQICIEELGTNQFKWFDLPVEQNEIDKWVEDEVQPIYDREQLSGIPEEFEVVDTDGINYLGSFTPIDTYNRYYEILENNDAVVVNFVMDELGYSVEQILQDESVLEEQSYYEATLDEYVEQMLDDGLFGDISESLRYYIDTNKLGNDLTINGDLYEYSFNNSDYIFMRY